MFYDNFVALCAERRKSPSGVAREIGLSNAAANGWKNGKTPNDTTLSKLSTYFNVPVSALIGEKQEKAPTPEGERSAIKIPVLGTVPAGIPIESIEEILDWEEIPASMCRGNREYFALQVKGDSMWPDYLPGDVVIVRKTPDCESGDDCIVYINGYDATLKQVKKQEDGSISIIPRNQSYEPHTYSPEEAASLPISIAGVVVELRRKIGKA